MQHGKCLYFKLGALVVLVRRFELWTSSFGVLCTNQLQPLLLLVVAHLLVVCVVALLCAPLLLPFSFFPFSVTICTHKLLIAHSSRGCVTSCPFGPNAVGLQYGLHGLGWSQRLSVISRIKGAEWSAFQKFAALPI